MREIKFKFYLKETRSNLIFSKIFDYAAIFSGTAKRFFNEQHPDSFIIAKEQFIGLKDKNKKEIYDGDRIQIKHPFKSREFTGEVIWMNYKFGCKDFLFIHFDDPSEIFSEGTEYIEVVGNIHQNKELLES